jgi:hypothetical protein
VPRQMAPTGRGVSLETRTSRGTSGCPSATGGGLVHSSALDRVIAGGSRVDWADLPAASDAITPRPLVDIVLESG